MCYKIRKAKGRVPLVELHSDVGARQSCLNLTNRGKAPRAKSSVCSLVYEKKAYYRYWELYRARKFPPSQFETLRILPLTGSRCHDPARPAAHPKMGEYAT
jgi:hypothetical protein